ncbi:MAG: hypothetical protein Q8L56_11855 [Rhodocyclaceae bacterium]|nr:hypothetical protein [Rhodocyclaceae bacterium]
MKLPQTIQSKSLGMSSKAFIPFHALILLLYGLVLTLPAIWSGFIVGDDTLTHLIWSRHFVDQLWAGDLYPRWLYDMNAGLGSPVFQFYGPVPYYFTALFRPLLSNDPEGWHQLGLAASLAVIASGFTAYAWLKWLAGERAALIGALLYMSAPYHLSVDLYQRFAFTELWGFVWMPLVMLFARASVNDGKAGPMMGLSLSYALLIMTHLPTTLLFSWVPVAYALWMAEPGERIGSLVRVAGGMLLGLGLSAIYLVPAMTTQQYVQFDLMTSGHFNFANNFLFNGPYINSDMDELYDQLGLITLTTAGLAVFAMAIDSLGKNGAHTRERLFWGAAGVLAVFMMLPLSEPVWRLITPLQFVQFPSRINTVLLVSCVALVTLAINTVLHRERKFQAALLLIASFGLLIPSIIALGNHLVVAREMGPPSLDRLVERFGTDYPDLAKGLVATKSSSCDYLLPRWLPRGQLEPARMMGIPRAQFSTESHVVDEEGKIRVTRWQPPHIVLEVTTGSEASIWIRQYFYPGWVARLGSDSARLEVKPSSSEGLLEIQVPSGTHQIWIEREPLPQERAGQVVSGVSLVVFAFIVFWTLLCNRPLPAAARRWR